MQHVLSAKLSYFVSLILLVFFMGVLALHPFASHEHAHAHTKSSAFTELHTGVVERSTTPLVAPTTLYVAIILVITLGKFAHALRQRGLQDVDIPAYLPLSFAFSSGILHPRAR